MKNFRDLKIWQKGFEIGIQAFKLVETFPKDEKFGLSGQITRAAVSIASNIAEGCSRSSEKDFNRFLEIALGSCFEIETQLLIAGSANFGNPQNRENLLATITEEQKMLAAFISQLKKRI
jgi:four helix bundle protein